ncbi:MAG TPA: hypothetical protein VFL36_10385 [Myxococcales bacterium]|nr:hypothetical protein [Myxococcales bacterium]
MEVFGVSERRILGVVVVAVIAAVWSVAIVLWRVVLRRFGLSREARESGLVFELGRVRQKDA